MTNLASESDSNVGDAISAPGLADQKPGLLTLSGDQPTTVYINAKSNADVMVAGFGLTSHGPFYTDGISWVSDAEYAMFVTFHFLKHVTSVECDALPYSPPYHHKQDLCILPPAPATYAFTVYFDNGKRHDPQIIVTPPGKQTPP